MTIAVIRSNGEDAAFPDEIGDWGSLLFESGSAAGKSSTLSFTSAAGTV